MQNILRRVQFQKLFIFTLCLSVLSGGFSPLTAQIRRAANVKKTPTKAVPPVTNPPIAPPENNFLSTASNTALASAWTAGELPAPMALPKGGADEIAAILAQKVAAKTDESIPALLTALQLAGFFVTDKNGQVALAPPDGKGQGLAINGWEAASAAKMLGEGKTTTLKDLNARLKSVPYFQPYDAGSMMLDGVRANAENTKNPYLRIWARFIIELGKNHPGKTDFSAGAAKPEEIELDAVQHLLLMRRLYGDLWARAERYRVQIQSSENRRQSAAQFTKASFSPVDSFASTGTGWNDSLSNYNVSPTADETTTDEKKIPCRMDGNAPTVMDGGATLIGEGYGKFLDAMADHFEKDLPSGGKFSNYAKFMTAANTVLAYAKFIHTYAALETKIIMEDAPPLIRTKNAVAGERKPMRAEVRMNLGNWQMYNCVRLAMTISTGLDFATLNDGPLGDVGVTWHLDEGGAGDRYSNSTGINQTGEQIVGITQNGIKRIQDKGVGTTTTVDANYTKTDDKGIGRVILEGSPQRNAKIGRLLQVPKQARVRTTIRMKAGEIKGDMVDAIGQALGGVAGVLTLPAELIYRSDWISTAALTVPVTDWQECERGWSGTISIVRKSSESSRSAGKQVIGYQESTTSRTYEYKGVVTITNAVPQSASGVNALNKALSTVSVQLKGESDATSKIVWEDSSIHTYRDNCGRNMTTRTLFKSNRQEEQGTGQAITDGNLLIDLINNTYNFHVTIPEIPGKITRSDLRRPTGYCDDNKPVQSSSESSVEIGRMPIEVSDGILDPKNPDVIEGARAFTAGNGEEIEIRWSLRNCR